jgi:hypothetical protein
LDNKAVIAVDDFTWIQPGHNRDSCVHSILFEDCVYSHVTLFLYSVRITSKKHYNADTLIIADFAVRITVFNQHKYYPLKPSPNSKCLKDVVYGQRGGQVRNLCKINKEY